MDLTIKVSNHLGIELLPSTNSSDSALRLFLLNDPEQSFIVFLSEVYLLRDALVTAGTRLAEIEKEARLQRNHY